MKNIYKSFNKTLFFVGVFMLGLLVSLPVKAQLGLTTDTQIGLEANVSPISAPARSSAALRESVDLLVQGVANASDSDFCTVLDASFIALTPEAKETLAWNKESYMKNVNLEVGSDVSVAVKEKLSSLKDSYTSINDAIGIAVSAETPISVRAATALRSSYLELMAEYRGGKPNDDRVAKLENFIDKVKSCVGGDENADNLGSIVSSSLKGGTIADTVLEVKRADISADEDVKTDMEAKDVSGRASLEQFAKSKISKDENIVTISTDQTQTSTTYKVRGKLFGFIPANMKVRATLASGGDVTVKYPWFSFLVRKGTRITSETIMETLGEDATVKFSGELSSSKQAEAISLLLSAFEPEEEATDGSSDDNENTESTQ